MDFIFSSEQTMLQDSASRFVQGAYGFDQYRNSLKMKGQSDGAIWRQIAECGWLGLPVTEAAGGLGGSTLDMALVAEALGEGLVLEPYIAGAVIPGFLLARMGSSDHREVLSALIEGQAQLALAYAERDGRFDPAYCALKAQAEAGGYRLAGSKHCVLNAPNADYLIVSARESDAPGSAEGISVFVVKATEPGISLQPYAIMGGGVAADVRFDDVVVSANARLADGYDALTAALDVAVVAECARALGAMKAMYERTKSYTRTRKQFGMPIADFQVIQHRLVDMLIEIEQARSMVLMAAVKVDGASAAERSYAASATKAYLCKASRYVSQQAVQLHGGIGMTEELDVGHYFRLLTAFWSRYGDLDFHLSRLDSLDT